MSLGLNYKANISKIIYFPAQEKIERSEKYYLCVFETNIFISVFFFHFSGFCFSLVAHISVLHHPISKKNLCMREKKTQHQDSVQMFDNAQMSSAVKSRLKTNTSSIRPKNCPGRISPYLHPPPFVP